MTVPVTPGSTPVRRTAPRRRSAIADAPRRKIRLSSALHGFIQPLNMKEGPAIPLFLRKKQKNFIFQAVRGGVLPRFMLKYNVVCYEWCTWRL